MTIPAITIDVDKALELLEAAVADRGPEYQYPVIGSSNGCTYFATAADVEHDLFPEVGAPACIVGWALDSLGVTVTDIGMNNSATGAANLLRELHDDHPEFEYTDYAARLLTNAQADQDNSLPYGIVIDRARNGAAEFKVQGHR